VNDGFTGLPCRLLGFSLRSTISCMVSMESCADPRSGGALLARNHGSKIAVYFGCLSRKPCHINGYQRYVQQYVEYANHPEAACRRCFFGIEHLLPHVDTGPCLVTGASHE